MTKRNPQKTKVILVGKGHDWQKCPRDVPDDTEIWGINDLVYKKMDIDRMFDMHDLDDYAEMDTICTKLISECGIPLVMPKKYDHLPTSEAFPLKEAIKEFGTDYFYTGIAFMICYAIMQGFKQIDCYGINMRGVDEKIKNAKACVEFWLGIAMGRGIKVTMHGKYTDCLKTVDRRVYGYNTPQTTPESIDDRALNVTIGFGLDRITLNELYHLLSLQKNSKYHLNYRPIPINDPDSILYLKSLNDIVIKHGDGKSHAGDIGFYHLYHVNRFANCDCASKMIYIEGNKERALKDWMEFSEKEKGNWWTNPKCKYWNGQAPHVNDAYFPKYDLPKEKALEKFYKEYHMIAIRSRYQYPSRFKMYDESILKTVKGQKELLKFLDYKEEDMVITAKPVDSKPKEVK